MTRAADLQRGELDDRGGVVMMADNPATRRARSLDDSLETRPGVAMWETGGGLLAAVHRRGRSSTLEQASKTTTVLQEWKEGRLSKRLKRQGRNTIAGKEARTSRRCCGRRGLGRLGEDCNLI